MDKRIWLRIGAAAILVAAVLIAVIINRGGGSPHQQSARLYKQAQSFINDGSLLEAKAVLKKLLAKFPDSPLFTQAQQKLWDLNIRILFSKLKTDSDIIYEVQPGDNLARIARNFNTTVELIKKSNYLTTDMIRPGDRLKINQDKFTILVDKSDNTLTLATDKEIVKVYPVGTGKDASTPVGTFTIKTKLIDPVWYKKIGGPIPAGSPENILGTRWLGFNAPQYGIHGGAKEDDLGRQVSGGCVRMLNRDVEELFSIVPRGTEVIIVD
jgi:lipoprotein-anchoring transpeptidase ErfK/SrfK